LAAVQTAQVPVQQQQQPAKRTIEELEKQNADLQKQLKQAIAQKDSAEAINKELQNLNDGHSKRIEALEQSERRKDVAAVLQGAFDENVFDEKVKFYVKTGLPISEIAEAVSPLKASRARVTKQASVNGNSNNYSSTVAIQNEGTTVPEKKEIPAWASNYLDLLNGGSS